MRSIEDDEGAAWEAFALPVKVAHLRDGAQLAFRSADGATVEAPVTFNSMDAAGFAIRTMSEKELRRRLGWAKTAAGVP